MTGSPPDYYRRRYRERRAWALKLLGSKCEHCGTKKNLNFHHRNPSEKSVDISSVFSRWSIAKLTEELAKCILLCADCHLEHHHPGHEMSHSASAYANGRCRCEIGRAANTERIRAYRARKKEQAS